MALMPQDISWGHTSTTNQECFKIDPAKKRWRLQVEEAAMAVNEGTQGTKKNDF